MSFSSDLAGAGVSAQDFGLEFVDLLDYPEAGLDGLDMNNSPCMPDFLTVIEAPPLMTAVHSPKPQPRPSSPHVQSRSRRTSVVTVRRRSSARPNETVLSVSVEDQNGRKSSLELPMDTAAADWLQTFSPSWLKWYDSQSLVPSHEGAMLPPSASAPRHRPIPQALLLDLEPSPYRSGVLNYINSVSPPHRSSSSPYADPTIFNGEFPTSRPVAPPQLQHVQTHIPAQPSFPALDGRPALPPGLAPFVNHHHWPQSHGRVPDKRGNKDTTVANDFYYSTTALPSLELPAFEFDNGKTVSYKGIEFDPKLRFTGHEFLQYTHYALQRPNRHPILRIQIQPAQYNHRYPRLGNSFKCRFADCPDKRGTILKGQARVCISEFEDENGDWLNPYHNAGYVHLYCLEKQVNFVELYSSATVTIIPEARSLRHEPPATTNVRANNPMSLNDIEQTVVHEWFQEMTARWADFVAANPNHVMNGPVFELAEEDTLTYRLTKAHGDNSTLKRVQEKRKLKAGGRITANLSEFNGNVGKQVALQKKMRAQPPKKRAANSEDPTSEQPTKKRRASPTPRASMPIHTPLHNGVYPSDPEASYQQVGRASHPPAQDGLLYPRGPQASYEQVGGAAYPPIQYDVLPPIPSAAAAYPMPALEQARRRPRPSPTRAAVVSPSRCRSPVLVSATLTRDAGVGRRRSSVCLSHIGTGASPSRRRSPALMSTTLTRDAGVGRRRSSARLASRRASKASNPDAAAALLILAGGELEGVGEADDLFADDDSLFGESCRVEEVE